MRASLGLVLVLATSMAAAVRADDAPANTPESAIVAVEQATSALKSSKARQSLRSLHAALVAAEDALMQFANNAAYLETLSPDQLATLSARMPLLDLGGGYDIYAITNPARMAELAAQHGLAEDQAFWSLKAAGRGADFLPDYLAPKLPSPCVRFGEDKLQPRYQAWRAFVAAHPTAYPDEARLELRDVEEVIALGTCACGDRASVVGELDGFVTRFPDSPANADALARSAELKAGTESRPVHCR